MSIPNKKILFKNKQCETRFKIAKWFVKITVLLPSANYIADVSLLNDIRRKRGVFENRIFLLKPCKIKTYLFNFKIFLKRKISSSTRATHVLSDKQRCELEGLCSVPGLECHESTNNLNLL